MCASGRTHGCGLAIADAPPLADVAYLLFSQQWDCFVSTFSTRLAKPILYIHLGLDQLIAFRNRRLSAWWQHQVVVTRRLNPARLNSWLFMGRLSVLDK